MSGVPIRLEHLHKRFGRDTEPAVADLSLDIPAGQITVLVGPSGCGKTTTLKMINRIVEPTSGRVLLGGEDVTAADPDRLRRRIGYVIQQIGLFPHMTIAANIAVVPRLLRWDATRVRARVEELLNLVGMPPERYRDRYPRELSGGQRQRVGVARALGGDPEVLLMDEPFGALDPITRARLQEELLRLQAEMRKTIVFVTHDIEEAIRLGDRIAILTDGARVAQYDTPATILAAPADAFVAEFVGSARLLRRLGLSTVGQVRAATWPTLPAPDGAPPDRAALERAAAASPGGAALLVDAQDRPRRWLRSADPDGSGAPVVTVEEDTSLYAALDALLGAPLHVVVVVDAAGRYRGVLGVGELAGILGTAAGDRVEGAQR